MYPKIETLYERDEKTFKVNPAALKNRSYSLLKTWHWTEKVDGTNVRCIWEGGQLSFGGKTDNAQLPGDLFQWLHKNVSLDKMRETFPESDAVIYGEGFGAGIQSGGAYSPTKKIIVFDVLVGGVWWLSDENVRDVAGKLSLEVVPSFGEMTMEEATEFVRNGFKSRCAVDPDKDAEGLVGRPLETLFDKKGARLIVKIKTRDF